MKIVVVVIIIIMMIASPKLISLTNSPHKQQNRRTDPCYTLSWVLGLKRSFQSMTPIVYTYHWPLPEVE